MAVCFKCGSAKSGALIACRKCSAAPQTNSEYAVSLALSDHLSTKDQLAQYSHELHNGQKLSVPREALVQALDALKDPQLLAMLVTQLSTPNDVFQASSIGPTAQQPQAPVTPPIPSKPAPSVAKTTLHRSPFAVLGATIRDDRRRIVELAEEKSLELDSDVCQKARSDLTNPRTRLSAEMAWLPGVSPRKAWQFLDELLHDPMAIRKESGLPTLAYLNLLAAVIESVDGEQSAGDFAEFIYEIAYHANELSLGDVLRDVNEDRTVSGFPEVKALDQVEFELSERKRYYCNAIKDALDRLSPQRLIEVMTNTVDWATASGENHAPRLIDDLVDSYEVETQGVLQKEAENVYKLIKAARDSASSGETAVKPYVDKLEAVARNWDKIAQPIQLSSKARGTHHEPSGELAYAIRSLAIDLFNTYDMLTQSQRLTGLIQELFSEVPDVAERVEQDADALADIFKERKQAAARRDEWAREITYCAEIGVIFKDTLSISPDGVSWKRHHFPLDSITRVRWGGVRHYVNGIPSGTNYTIAFGDNHSEAVVELKKENIYSTFIDKLWRAVCVRLIGGMIEMLKSGQNMQFGNALVHDDGITLIKHKFLGGHEKVRCSWGQIHIWSSDGSFFIGSRDDKKIYSSASYIHDDNTHILEQAIRMAFKEPGMCRLSDLLQ